MDRRRWVEPDLPDARIEESWHAIAARTGRRPSRARVWVPAAGVLAAAAAALVAFLAPGASDEDRSAWVGTAMRTGNEPMQVELADGSAIDAEPHSRLELLEGSERTVRLALRRGGATFEVTRNPSRDFVVQADDVQVRVIGTRFRVSRLDVGGETTVQVDVERGRVEVRVGDETRVLGAGETWRRRRQEVVEVTAEATEMVSDATAIEAHDDGRSRTRRRRVARDRGPNPTEIFENARAARRQGDAREAARLYARLIEEHPGNARAPLAALELGRVRMDALGDPRGAAEALETALRLSPRSPFREDAMARLVRAHEAAGYVRSCQRARQAYLAEFPDGRWAQDVERRCP